ncbi:hypothetical protein PVAP13_8NG137500 [Panicum virgatum]|uniref:Uncharacterized protein n=1 Tax=Panicum virgatum TaxID=38727 RepID=A0A8T0PB88_PANVG|nr:hypothetical protein PVAP13_8NG137500 [Panicum virgatum]
MAPRSTPPLPSKAVVGRWRRAVVDEAAIADVVKVLPPPPESGAESRRSSPSPTASPEFEFWMVGRNRPRSQPRHCSPPTSSSPAASCSRSTTSRRRPPTATAPLKAMPRAPPRMRTPRGSRCQKRKARLESGIAPTPDLPAVTIKWKDIFKAGSSEAKDSKKVERHVSSVSGNAASVPPAPRKVSSALCSCSNSRGESSGPAPAIPTAVVVAVAAAAAAAAVAPPAAEKDATAAQAVPLPTSITTSSSASSTSSTAQALASASGAPAPCGSCGATSCSRLPPSRSMPAPGRRPRPPQQQQQRPKQPATTRRRRAWPHPRLGAGTTRVARRAPKRKGTRRRAHRVAGARCSVRGRYGACTAGEDAADDGGGRGAGCGCTNGLDSGGKKDSHYAESGSR